MVRCHRPLLWLAVFSTAFAGCSGPELRGQKEEETDRERYGVKTVGDVSTFGNAEPITVGGVGLVEGLAGTGSAAVADDYRKTVENELRRAKTPNVKQILNSSDFSIVLVSAVISPGSKKGDPLDLEISLPPGSKTSSLRGGVLRRCTLYNYEMAGRVSPTYAGGSTSALRGNGLARAEGPLLVSMGDKDSDQSEKRARIWGGGVCLFERQFHVLLNNNQQFARVASNVANRINTAFQGTITQTPGHELAVAKSNTIVTLNVPPQYKHNLPRLLRVVRMVPLEETQPDGKTKRMPYKQQLHDDLLEPARTVVSALRLEALGTDSIPALKEGLRSQNPLVRFCAAEALAYLGSPSCGEELGRVARVQPYLRAFAMTALASLDEAVSQLQLKELLSADLEPEVRYGAFRALKTLDDRDSTLNGELLADTFWLHTPAPESKPLVHLSTSRRAEIVVFGETPKLRTPCSLLSGSYHITAAEGDQKCTITYLPFGADEGQESRTSCSLELPAIIKMLAEQGATYPEVIEVILQADRCQNLSCRVVVDKLPQSVTVETLAEVGKRKASEMRQDDVEIVKPDVNLGTTPTLYQKTPPRRTPDRAAKALQQQKGRTEKATAERE